MKWSWKIGTFSDIKVYIHATFLLLIGWIAISYWLTERSLTAVFNGVIFILLLFVCVTLHEFGHALAARKFNIPTQDITLLPIGGVARLERMPEDPKQELWVALAGPSVNVVIAALLFIGIQFSNALLQPLSQITVTEGSLLQRLMIVNLWLVLFNLIPAFPMDGGRAVRALLAMRLEYTRATQIAAQLGQAIAFIFGFIGLFSNPFLLFIAFFVWIGAAQEASMVQMKSALSGIPISRAMLTRFRSLQTNDSLAKAVEMILAGSQQDFPVIDDGQVVGILTRQDLMSGLNKHGPQSLVKLSMTHEFETIEASQMLEQVSQCLQNAQCKTMPVLRNGDLVGLLTMDNVGEFMMIRQALGSSQPPTVLPGATNNLLQD